MNYPKDYLRCRRTLMSMFGALIAVMTTLGMLGASASASALSMTGDQLLENCQSPEDAQQGLCEGFIEGTADGLAVGMARAKACWFKIPPNVDILQMVDATVRFLTVHPNERVQAAASLTLQALREAFPC
jgi:hypothetical protein